LKISQKIEKRNDFVCNDFVVGTVAGIFKIRFQNFRCWKISIYPNYLDLGHPNVESEFRKCLTPNLNKVFGYIYSAQIGLMINEVRYSSVQTSDTYVFWYITIIHHILVYKIYVKHIQLGGWPIINEMSNTNLLIRK